MTATLSSTSYQPTARGRIRMLALATAVALAVGGLVAAASQADVGGVYFDDNDNAAAGDPNFLFNATFTGGDNVGLGRAVMTSLTGGNRNIGLGSQALVSNTSGNNNVATGSSTLFASTTGSNNVATGNFALSANSTGNDNVAVGTIALASNPTGNNNVAIGANAGKKLTAGSNNIDIANPGKAGQESGTIRIGNGSKHTATFIAGISGTTPAGATQPVVINSAGKLGVAPATAARPSLTDTVARLTEQLKHQQRQIERLRKQVKGG
jgi:hypothetical protein